MWKGGLGEDTPSSSICSLSEGLPFPCPLAQKHLCPQHVWVEDQSDRAASKSNRMEKLTNAPRLSTQAPCVKDLPQANMILMATCLQTPEVEPSFPPQSRRCGHTGTL